MSAPPPPPSSRQRVARIPELLEKILLCLDDGNVQHLKSLFLSQLVSRDFHATIQDSPDLSRALFLKPTRKILRDIYTLNPFFRQRCIGIGSDYVLPPIKGWEQLVQVNVDYSMMGRGRHGMDNVWVTFGTFDPDDELRCLEREGSWGKMVLMRRDYRVTAVRVRKSSCGGAEYMFRGDWDNPTVGELFDVAFPKSRDE
ncbi:hypothetical protein AC578_9087 [Pseudocercospora eumusae]|uniref:F-box domain-containing protein n=1 Tax=Pseudocercospora eumusae TaxID=321146 RepID=A0A139GU04_9PEZI|nr:hypothetical protein AC578_9087 [Pseudocercospora eumusae]